MRELDWWDIGRQGLKIPFYQWRTLLASLAAAVASILIAAILITGLALLYPEPQSSFVDAISPYVLLGLAFIATTTFQWCWMTALWHNGLRHCLTFFLHRNFWQFAALLLLLFIADILFWNAKASLQGIIGSLLGGNGRPHTGTMLGFSLGAAGLHVLLLARVMIWPAYTIARQELVGPLVVWRATDGLFWDFIFLNLRVQIPLALAAIFFGAIALLVFRSAGSLLPIGLSFAVLMIAATNAACLLAYFEVVGKREPASLPVY